MAGELGTAASIFTLPVLPPGTVRGLMLEGYGFFSTTVSFTSTGVTVTGTQTTSINWFVPAGTTQIQINVTYDASLDVAGARPYATLHADPVTGVSTQTVIAPSGGGAQIITMTFGATAADGVLGVDLVYPNAGLTGSVTWAPQVQAGQAANIGNGGAGSPVKGQSITSLRVYSSETGTNAHFNN